MLPAHAGGRAWFCRINLLVGSAGGGVSSTAPSSGPRPGRPPLPVAAGRRWGIAIGIVPFCRDLSGRRLAAGGRGQAGARRSAGQARISPALTVPAAVALCVIAHRLWSQVLFERGRIQCRRHRPDRHHQGFGGLRANRPAWPSVTAEGGCNRSISRARIRARPSVMRWSRWW